MLLNSHLAMLPQEPGGAQKCLEGALVPAQQTG